MVIDFLFLMIILIMSVFGMRKGFIESFTDFLNLVVGISIALSFYVDLSFFISKYISINSTVIIFSSILIIFLFTLIILRLITSLLLFLFDGSISSYKIPNMILGFMLGAFKGVLALVLFSVFLKSLFLSGFMKFYFNSQRFLFFWNHSKTIFLVDEKNSTRDNQQSTRRSRHLSGNITVC